jgi:arsenate reductase-like glutaredoxin family protein
MGFQRWISLTFIVVVALSIGVGAGYWVNANQHMEHENGHMMNQGSNGHMMGNGQHKDMIQMPMMHVNMSKEEMNQFCTRMQQRHKAIQTKRQKTIEKLNLLVQSMKQASGTDKIEAMQKLLVELVEQHNERGKMMIGSMHSMMGSMMGMHRMSSQNLQQMMQVMKDCPMMNGSMSPSEQGHNGSTKEHHGQ